MDTHNFQKYAKPWLDQLKDDPNQPEATDLTNPTTFPVPDFDWNDNRLLLLDDDDISDIQASDSEVDAEAARGARPMAGLDVLAFYKSFRFIDRPPFRGRWGIFLLDAGIEGLTRDLMDLSPSLPRSEARQFATAILLIHERYHFWIDAWALGQEITPLISNPVKRYEYYLSGKRSVELTPDDLEESLANHYVFRKLKERKFSNRLTAATTLRKILLDAPSPYSDCFFDTTERIRREGVLATAVANGQNPLLALAIGRLRFGSLEPTVLSASVQPVDRRHPVVGTHRCPTYYVRASGYAALVTPFQGPKLKEFRRFMINYLAGKEEKFTDHPYFRIDNGEKVRFPNPHDSEVRGYELKGTLHKAGMTQREFFTARKNTDCWTKKCPRSPVKSPLGQR